MNEPGVLYSVKDRVAEITLNRPRVKNALDQDSLDRLVAAIDDARTNEKVWVLRINAAGTDFCVGQDVRELSQTGGHKSDYFEPVYVALKGTYKPVVCLVRGLCLAGGAGIAMGADVRIFSDNARLGWPHAKIGICSIGAPSTLARMIPMNIALEYMFTGDFMDASRAYHFGLANHVVPDAELDSRGDEAVRKLLLNAPLSMRASKKATLTTLDMPYGEAVSRAHVFLDELLNSEDAKEGMRAFLEKRKPVWQAK